MERNSWGGVLRKFCLGMEDPKDLADIKPLVAAYNHKMLRFCSALFSIIFFVISFISFSGVTSVYEYPSVYIAMFASSLAIFLLSVLVFKPDSSGTAVLVTFYCLQLIGYVYGYYTGVVHGPFPAVTFIVMVFLLPPLLCDSPYRGNIILLVACAFFLIGSHQAKGAYIFSNDLINVISYAFVSLLMNTHQQMTRMEDFKNRRIIRLQRDTDSMTGAMTKAAFEGNTVKLLKDEESEGCLLILDIDNFKSINDNFGHSIGDFFIANTGRCILECCRASDFVGRFGGDEFVILIQGKLSRDNVMNKVSTMTSRLKTFFRENTKYERFSISVGCTLYQKGSVRPDYQTLFDQADHALYVAKNSGKDQCVIYGD